MSRRLIVQGRRHFATVRVVLAKQFEFANRLLVLALPEIALRLPILGIVTVLGIWIVIATILITVLAILMTLIK